MKPEIMLLGTFHMAVEPEMIHKHSDELSSITASLQEWNPTKIGVEKSFFLEEEINKRLKQFLQGEQAPAYDEVEQIAFPLAEALQQDRLYPVDEMVDMSTPSLDQVFSWAEEHQPELLKEILTIQQSVKQMEDKQTLAGYFRYINDEDYKKQLKRVYMKLTRVGDRQHQIGVHWLKQWHHRDLAMAANILRTAAPGDRILVLVGSDHLHLVERFLKESGDVTIQDVTPYLPEKKNV
ncbi:hypothetical protein GLW04_15360 [Halobacillus litoralis]|uniref:TraB/GumN family protein n=1 Tax=Halobacillus litoralis TaxID=45668 RepID=A0A845DVY0_9BACI|nr:DUF5694 domain-containing protein [Halobacillus litoralis]MYL21278.1 hypothetical protein [Halobacillus litoralis]